MLDGIPASGKGALFIGGTWRPPAGGTYARVVDPSTGRTLGEAPVASSEEARAALAAVFLTGASGDSRGRLGAARDCTAEGVD